MEITGRLKRAAAVMISTAMIIGMCGNALAEETDSSGGRETIAAEGINERNEGGMAGEGTGGMEAGAAGANGAGDSTTESAGTETGVAGTSQPGREPGREMGSETGGSGADSVSGAQDGGSQEGSGGRGRGKEDSNNPDDGAPGSGSLWVGEYEIFAPGGSKDTLDVLRKGRQAKVVVNVRSNGIKTSEVGKRGVTVTKLSDSFRNGENPKVKITSDKEDDLEFTVTFTRLTYTGKGDVLRLKVGFKSSGIPSE